MFVTFGCVALGAAVAFAPFGYKVSDWAAPFDIQVSPNVSPPLLVLLAFTGCVLCTLVVVGLSAELSMKYLAVTSPPSNILGVVLWVLHGLWVVAALPIGIALALAFIPALRQTSTSMLARRLSMAAWLALLGVFMTACLVGPANEQPFQSLTLSALFNGVSPVLPTMLASAAVWVLTYSRLRQHYLVRQSHTAKPPVRSWQLRLLVHPLRTRRHYAVAGIVVA